MDLKSFLFALYSGNDDIISAKCTYQRGITPGTYASMGWDLSTRDGGIGLLFHSRIPGGTPTGFLNIYKYLQSIPKYIQGILVLPFPGNKNILFFPHSMT